MLPDSTQVPTRINPEHDEIMLMEFEIRRRFDDNILKTALYNFCDPAHLKHELTQIARSHDTTVEIVEEIAQVLLQNKGVDLEAQEFTSMVELIKTIESITDEGLRNFKLLRLARRLKMSKTDMMNAYYKALINQAPLIDYTFDELDQLCSPIKEWLVSGWIPKGIVLLLHALGGAGKSLMIYELIECIVKGQPWNGYPVKQGRALILQSDEPVIVTRERMEIRELVRGYPVTVVPGWQVENIASLEAKLKQFQETGDPVMFCMVDSVTAINRNAIVSENDTEYARFMLKLNDLSDRYGCTFAVIHHSNSAGESRGTKALYNSASEVWGLSTIDERSGERILRVQKTRMGRPPGRYRFQFDEDNFTFAYLGTEGEEANEEIIHTEKRLELWLNEDEHRGIPYSPEEIAHHLGANQNTIRKVLKEMWAKGTVLRCRKSQGKGFLYHTGHKRLADRIDQPQKGNNQSTINSPSSGTAEDALRNDRLIDKNPHFYQAKLSDFDDQSIISPETHDSNDSQIDRCIDHELITLPLSTMAIDLEDRVIVKGIAVWHCSGSDKLPQEKVPPKWRDKSTLPIEVLNEDLFFELTDCSVVLAIESDRVTVRNQQTGRISVFRLSDVTVLEKVNYAQ